MNKDQKKNRFMDGNFDRVSHRADGQCGHKK